MTSFQRQLNLYGFRRITQGPDAGAYYHEMFLQGRPALCYRMKRQKVKGTGHKQPADVNTEPNFYSMPAILPDRRADGTASVPLTTPPATSRSFAPHSTLSPGIGSVPIAADLLRGIASGRHGLPVAPFVGLPPATSPEEGTKSKSLRHTMEDQPARPLSGASFLPVSHKTREPSRKEVPKPLNMGKSDKESKILADEAKSKDPRLSGEEASSLKVAQEFKAEDLLSPPTRGDEVLQEAEKASRTNINVGFTEEGTPKDEAEHKKMTRLDKSKAEKDTSFPDDDTSPAHESQRRGCGGGVRSLRSRSVASS